MSNSTGQKIVYTAIKKKTQTMNGDVVYWLVTSNEPPAFKDHILLEDGSVRICYRKEKNNPKKVIAQSKPVHELLPTFHIPVQFEEEFVRELVYTDLDMRRAIALAYCSGLTNECTPYDKLTDAIIKAIKENNCAEVEFEMESDTVIKITGDNVRIRKWKLL